MNCEVWRRLRISSYKLSKPHKNRLSSRYYICESGTAVTINSDDSGGESHTQSLSCRTRYNAAAGWIDFSPPDVTTSLACAWWLNTLPISVSMQVLMLPLVSNGWKKEGEGQNLLLCDLCFFLWKYWISLFISTASYYWKFQIIFYSTLIYYRCDIVSSSKSDRNHLFNVHVDRLTRIYLNRKIFFNL